MFTASRIFLKLLEYFLSYFKVSPQAQHHFSWITPLCKSYVAFHKPCIHKRAAYALCRLHVARIWCTVNSFSTNLRRAKDTLCMERTPGISSSLCVCAKYRHILVRGEWYVNHLRMAQRRFAVLSTHKCIWFANSSARSCILGFK